MALSQLIRGYWAPTRTGYILRMTDRDVLTRKEWWRAFEAQRESAIAARRELFLTAMDTPPKEPKAPPGKQLDPSSINGYAYSRRAYALFHGLPDDVKRDIAGACNVYALYTGFYGGNQIGGSVPVKYASLSAGAREALQPEFDALPGIDDDTKNKSTVLFTNLGFQVNVSLCLPKLGISFTTLSLHVITRFPDTKPLYLDHPKLPENVRSLGKSATADLRLLAKYQEATFWPSEKPAVLPVTGNNRCFLQMLRRLASNTTIEFVTDCYFKKCDLMTLDELARPVGNVNDELNSMAVATDVSWKQTQLGITLIRNNRWYRDDATQVPQSALAEILARNFRLATVNSGGNNDKNSQNPARLQAEDDATLLQTYSPWQLTVGIAWYIGQGNELEAIGSKTNNSMPNLPLARLADRVMREYSSLMLYHGFDAPSRTALFSTGLPVRSLPDQMVKQLAGLVTDPGSLFTQDVSITFAHMKETELVFTYAPAFGPQDVRPALIFSTGDSH